jgi:hypothetical protein
MRKLNFAVSLFCTVLMVLISACGPTQTSPQPTLILPTIPPDPTATPAPTSAQQTNASPISISVEPFYNSQGTQINVGTYSEQIRTDDLQTLSKTAQEMAQQKEVLTPEQMYVLAIRLYDLGDKDDSIYWYYEAQFRARLFQQAIEPAQMVKVGDKTFELSTAYNSFQKMAGEFINGYAGCDLDNWIKFATMVQNDNPSPPALDQIFPNTVFVQRDQWQKINDDVAAGLAKLIDYISKNGETIKQQRAQKSMDTQYCS